MGERRQARENALKALYLIDVAGLSVDETIEIIKRGNSFSDSLIEFMDTLVRGTIELKTHIDEIITKYTENWEISRMSTVDRNILRLASYELMKMKETPVNVIINEAIEIAKTYSTADSGRFVNGILDKIKQVREF